MNNIEELLKHIFAQKSVPTFKAPVIIFESDKDNNLYPSGLINQQNAEKYADWWMDNQ